MPDDLRRRFQDKIHSRSLHPGRPAGPGAPDLGAALPHDAIRIHAVEHGLFPALETINPRFRPGGPSIRLTLDVGRNLRRGEAPVPAAAADGLLALCPGLTAHRCGAPGGMDGLIGRPGPSPPPAGDARSADDGMPTAHLVEHVALDLYAVATGREAGNGAVCEHSDRHERFDIFLACDDPPLGRATAVLAAAAVRDLRGMPDRLELHRRCRDLLTLLAGSSGRMFAPEDVAHRCGPEVGDTRAALKALVRLGFLEALAAPLTFSSVGGILFRRCGPPAA